MQSFKNIVAEDLISLSRQKILDNLNTIMSNSSGSTYPTANLQQGMLFYNTTNKCFYVLEDVEAQTWAKVLDLLNPFGAAQSAEKIKTARKINGVDFDGTKDITITAAASGGNAATVGGASPGNTAGNVLVIGSDGKVPSSNMPIATATVLGAVKQGANITIAADGTISGSPALEEKITTTASLQTAQNPTVSSGMPSSYGVTMLSQNAGLKAGTYNIQSLLQSIVNLTHSHNLVYRNGANCNCDCGSGDDDGSNY